MESNITQSERQLLKLPEVAGILGIGVSSVQKLVAEGALPVIRFGRAVRVPCFAVQAWIQAQVSRPNGESIK